MHEYGQVDDVQLPPLNNHRENAVTGRPDLLLAGYQLGMSRVGLCPRATVGTAREGTGVGAALLKAQNKGPHADPQTALVVLCLL